MSPKRIQRKRTKGWRMPEGAVYVGRPGKFGNPFRAYKCDCCGYWDVRDDNDVTYMVDHDFARRPEVRADASTWTTRHEACRESVRLYDDELTYWVGGRLSWDPDFAEAVQSLRGLDLACWCPLEDEHGNRFPCHADVLLEIANRGDGQ